MGSINLGTSGWSYKDWVGPFYRDNKESKLKAYHKVFDTVEINSTFYAYPKKGMVFGWLKATRPNFVFSAKIPKLITHDKLLDLDRGVEGDLQSFCDLMGPLKAVGRLGCLLIQLPPSFDYQPDTLEDFFRILPKEFRFAVEFRNLSWMRKETWSLLEKNEVAYVVVDEPLLPPEIHLTTDIAYIRWHGRGSRPWFNYHYEVSELEPWIPKVKEIARNINAVYGYFNNHFHGYAVENCLQVLDMLSIQTEAQQMASKRVEKHLGRLKAERQLNKRLEVYMPRGESAKPALEKLLDSFIDSGRLKRAKDIVDSEVRIVELGEDHVQAKVKDYHIIIDSEKSVILHDCADWNKLISDKRFCKHLGKLFLFMPDGKARSILEKIQTEKGDWSFSFYP